MVGGNVADAQQVAVLVPGVRVVVVQPRDAADLVADAPELADVVPDGGAVQERKVHGDDLRELAAYPEREPGDA